MEVLLKEIILPVSSIERNYPRFKFISTKIAALKKR
jgi:hypothetical protein